MYLARLKDLRKEKKITQAQVAKYLGITQQHYSSYERNVIKLNVDILVKLATFYNTSTDYILGLNTKNPNLTTEKTIKSKIEIVEDYLCLKKCEKIISTPLIYKINKEDHYYIKECILPLIKKEYDSEKYLNVKIIEKLFSGS